MKDGTLHTDNIMRGALLVALAVFMIAAMNTLAKFLSAAYHPIEMVFYRNIIIIIPLCLYFQLAGKWHLLRTQRFKSHILRGLVGTCGVVTAFWAVSLLPLADAVTLMYTAPLFVTALSYPLLKEKVGLFRSVAVVIGFGGVALVAAPTGDALPMLGITLALCTAMFQALTQILMRDLGHTEHTLTTVFYFISIGTIVTGLATPLVWQGGPQAHDIGLFLLLGLAGGLQQIIKTKGYALAPVAITSPINYTGLVWASLFGWMVWQTVPGLNMISGASLIILCNMLIVWRERRLKKRALSA